MVKRKKSGRWSKRTAQDKAGQGLFGNICVSESCRPGVDVVTHPGPARPTAPGSLGSESEGSYFPGSFLPCSGVTGRDRRLLGEAA